MAETILWARRGFGDGVGEDELDALVECDGAGRQVSGEQGVGVLVFLPGVDSGLAAIGNLGELLGHASFFKGGANDVGGGVRGEHPSEEALGLAGMDAGEVDERGAAGDDDGGDGLLLHEGAGAAGAGLTLGEGDGGGLGGAVGQSGDGRREGGSVGLHVSLGVGFGDAGWNRDGGCSVEEEAAARGHG